MSRLATRSVEKRRRHWPVQRWRRAVAAIVVAVSAPLAATDTQAQTPAPPPETKPDVLAELPSSPPCALEPGPDRAVTRATGPASLLLDDRTEVSLFGILPPDAGDAAPQPTPRRSPPNAAPRAAPSTATSAAPDKPPSPTWPPAEAALAALTRLAAGRTVSLAFPAGQRTDRYGRVVAHVVVTDPAGARQWLQARLVADGQARVHARTHDAPCHDALLAFERRARAASLGLWSSAAYQVRPADRPSELARYRNTFQLVRGRVERVRSLRDRTILELTSAERPPVATTGRQPGATRLVVPRTIERRLSTGRATALLGTNILVRSWIADRNGPELELATPADLTRED
jgi:pyruvate/2-oxoglutarate dehydrogenase complex dihydrolipoamide acyltransferase (E2) component